MKFLGKDIEFLKEEIKARINIVDFIERYVKLKRVGKNYQGLCPFHPDSKTPSFTVSEDKGLYHCFGCGKAGDIFKFLMDYEGISFWEAFRRLAQEAGVDISGLSLSKNRIDRDLYYDIVKTAQLYYKSKLKTKKVIDYLKSRDLKVEWIEDYGGGYAPAGWDNLLKFLKTTKGYKEEDILKVGLIIKRESSPGFYDRFRDRLLLPFYNDSGMPIGFTGRILDDNKDEPKYINSPETPLYQKSKVLFGFNKSRDAIRKLSEVFVVEGNLDFISLYYRGIENVVALSGTAFSDIQALKLKRLSDKATLILDADNAGIKASVKSIATLINNDIEVFAVLLPPDEDPDSFIRKVGSDDFLEYIEKNKKNFVEYEYEAYAEDINKSPSKKAEFIKRMITFLNSIEDDYKRGVYLQTLVDLSGISIELFQKSSVKETSPISFYTYNKKNKDRFINKSNKKETFIHEEEVNIPQVFNIHMILFLLNNPEFIEKIVLDDKINLLLHPIWKDIYDRMLEVYEEDKTKFYDRILEFFISEYFDQDDIHKNIRNKILKNIEKFQISNNNKNIEDNNKNLEGYTDSRGIISSDEKLKLLIKRMEKKVNIENNTTIYNKEKKFLKLYKQFILRLKKNS